MRSAYYDAYNKEKDSDYTEYRTQKKEIHTGKVSLISIEDSILGVQHMQDRIFNVNLSAKLCSDPVPSAVGSLVL